MPKSRPIFFNALLLTGVNLLLRLISTGFQVFLSRRIGAEGIGITQLVLSVTALAMTAGIAGVRTTSMYLCAEELGRKQQQNVPWMLSGCFRYSLVCSGMAAVIVYAFAPEISAKWIGYTEAAIALRIFAVFLPLTCLCCVLSGYFTAASRIPTLAGIQIAEQLCSMAVTIALIYTFVKDRPERAAIAMLLGSGIGNMVSLCTLTRIAQRDRLSCGSRIPVARRLLSIALPLALADDLKALISTLENLMVPKRLALYPGTTSPLASFGTVCGMVFPVIFFPAAILFGLGELLIPEMARCRASGSETRIRYLCSRSLRVTLLYGITVGGILFLVAEELCTLLYKTAEAAHYLRLFSLLIPMIYCDAVTDAMVKGLGQQKICVRYNILTSSMDVVLLFVLLPKYGMNGYFLSYFITHFINFVLSLRRLLKLTGHKLQIHVPLFAASDVLCGMVFAVQFHTAAGKIISFFAVFVAMLYLTGSVSSEDLYWLKGMIKAPIQENRRS